MADERFRAVIRKHAPSPFLRHRGGHVSAYPRRFDGIRIVLFDVYGTILVPVTPDQRMVRTQGTRLSGLFRAHGFTSGPHEVARLRAEEIVRAHERARTHGIDFPEVDILEIWESVFARTDDARQAGKMDRARLAEFVLAYEMITNPVVPASHVRGAIASCARRGIRLGIVSNAQFYTEPILEHALKRPLERSGFDRRFVTYSYKTGIAKPSPVLFDAVRRAVFDAGFDPKSVLFIGNDPVCDIVPALRAGFTAALYTGSVDGPKADLQTDVGCAEKDAIELGDYADLPRMIL